MDKEDALPTDGATEFQDLTRTPDIPIMSVRLETGAPQAQMTGTLPTETTTVMETGPALPTDGAKEYQDDRDLILKF